MDDLYEGVARFRHDVFPNHRRLFERLAHGQTPTVLFVACSDSRVDPSLITQTPPGTLFVLRNAGNLVPDADNPVGGEAATLHYAVEELGVHHIVVCGHSGCGAMTALVGRKRLPRVLTTWLRHAEPVLRRVPRGDVEAAIAANVLLQLDHLRTHASVARAVRAGDLQLHGWVYDIGSGRIRVHDPGARAFVDLDDTHVEDDLLSELKDPHDDVPDEWIDHGPYSVVLLDAGSDRAGVVEAVAQVTGESVDAAVARVDNVPALLLHGLTAAEAELVEAWIADAGGTVSRTRD
jgi:carbonic anhydrase